MTSETLLRLMQANRFISGFIISCIFIQETLFIMKAVTVEEMAFKSIVMGILTVVGLHLTRLNQVTIWSLNNWKGMLLSVMLIDYAGCYLLLHNPFITLMLSVLSFCCIWQQIGAVCTIAVNSLWQQEKLQRVTASLQEWKGIGEIAGGIAIYFIGDISIEYLVWVIAGCSTVVTLCEYIEVTLLSKRIPEEVVQRLSA